MKKTPLFLTNEKDAKDAYCRIIAQTANAVVASIADDSAYSGPTPQQLKELIKVDDILPKNGLGFQNVMECLSKQILPNFLRTSSTNYMAHLHCPATIESIAAELILSTFNQSMDSWDQSPVATEIELEVIKMLCSLYGFNYEQGADGVFTSGGSQSNQTAIILARDWFCSTKLNYDIKKHGLPENFRKLRMYTSKISHFSMEKTAHVLGLGYESVVKVPVDAQKRMDINILTSLIENDIKCGNIPFLVVATIGTTDFGSIDSVSKIAQICQRHHIWLHADAAYGSGVVLSEKYKNRIAGLDSCDSITVDFHKMFLQPISSSAVLVKNGSTFEALTIHVDYLNRTEDEEDGYTNLVDKSLQTTRRFDALKVWVAFQTRGKDGWSKIISTSMENADYLYEKLQKDDDFIVVTKPEISSVVFRLKGGDEINKKIRRKLIHEHGVVIGQTVSDNFVCLKFTLLNPLITHTKIDSLVELIRKLGKI